MELCQRFDLVREVKWYNHKPASVVENDKVKILWDFNIQTDHVIQHRRSDIVVPGDKRVEMKEQEKVDNHSELRREVKKIWNLSQVVVVPVVMGALGMTSRRLKAG